MAGLKGFAADLLPEVLSWTTVEDTLSLKEAVQISPEHGRILEECKRRLSVQGYLEKSFGHSKRLLKTMSQNFVYLSGSRSLEFLVPGSATESSDWDFYTQDNAGRVSAFMRDMDAIEVVWDRPVDKLQKCLQERSGSIILSRAALEKLNGSDLVDTVALHGHELEVHADDDVYKKKCIEVKDRKVTVRDYEFEDDYIPDLAYMIHGSFTARGRATAIQLMVGIDMKNDPTGMGFLHSFHSSCVQLFISAHTACHLYGKMVSKKCTYQWHNNTDTAGKKVSAAKYMDRGFCRVETPVEDRSFTVRNSDDSMSTILLDLNPVEAPQDVVACYASCARSMVWCQTPWGTNRVELPIGIKRPHWPELLGEWVNDGSAHFHGVAAAWSS